MERNRFDSDQIKNSDWGFVNYYALICQTFEQLKQTEINVEILEKLKEMQISPDFVISELKENIFSVETCCYKQLFRELRIQKLSEIRQQHESLSSSPLERALTI
jgi:hypothetical protein